MAMFGMGLGAIDGDIEVGVEKKIGTYTIGGTTYDRYIKIVDCEALPNATTKQKAHGATFTNIISISGVAITSSGNRLPLPRASSNTTYCIDVYVDNTNINFSTAANFASYNAYVCIEYYR